MRCSRTVRLPGKLDYHINDNARSHTEEEVVLLHIAGDCKKTARRDRLPVGHPPARDLKAGQVAEEQRVHQRRLARPARSHDGKELPGTNYSAR